MNEVNQNNLMQQSDSRFPPVLIFYDQKDSVRKLLRYDIHRLENGTKKVCLLVKSSQHLTHADIYTHTQKHTLILPLLYCIEPSLSHSLYRLGHALMGKDTPSREK